MRSYPAAKPLPVPPLTEEQVRRAEAANQKFQELLECAKRLIQATNTSAHSSIG